MSVASSEDVLKALTKERKVDIVRDDETKKVIIPKNMKLGDVIRWLKRQQAAEETEISFVKDFLITRLMELFSWLRFLRRNTVGLRWYLLKVSSKFHRR